MREDSVDCVWEVESNPPILIQDVWLSSTQEEGGSVVGISVNVEGSLQIKTEPPEDRMNDNNFLEGGEQSFQEGEGHDIIQKGEESLQLGGGDTLMMDVAEAKSESASSIGLNILAEAGIFLEEEVVDCLKEQEDEGSKKEDTKVEEDARPVFNNWPPSLDLLDCEEKEQEGDPRKKSKLRRCGLDLCQRKGLPFKQCKIIVKGDDEKGEELPAGEEKRLGWYFNGEDYIFYDSYQQEDQQTLWDEKCDFENRLKAEEEKRKAKKRRRSSRSTSKKRKEKKGAKNKRVKSSDGDTDTPPVEVEEMEDQEGDDDDEGKDDLSVMKAIGGGGIEVKNHRLTEIIGAEVASLESETETETENDDDSRSEASTASSSWSLFEPIIKKKEPKFRCLTCARPFSNRMSLQVHTRLHTGEKPYGCEHCGDRFIDFPYLEYHKKNVHPQGCLQVTPSPMISPSLSSTSSNSSLFTAEQEPSSPLVAVDRSGNKIVFKEVRIILDRISVPPKVFKGSPSPGKLKVQNNDDDLQDGKDLEMSGKGEASQEDEKTELTYDDTFICPYCEEEFGLSNELLIKHLAIHEDEEPEPPSGPSLSSSYTETEMAAEVVNDSQQAAESITNPNGGEEQGGSTISPGRSRRGRPRRRGIEEEEKPSVIQQWMSNAKRSDSKPNHLIKQKSANPCRSSRSRYTLRKDAPATPAMEEEVPRISTRQSSSNASSSKSGSPKKKRTVPLEILPKPVSDDDEDDDDDLFELVKPRAKKAKKLSETADDKTEEVNEDVENPALAKGGKALEKEEGVQQEAVDQVSSSPVERSTESKKQPFECAICGKQFKLQQSLRTHYLKFHRKAKTYACKFCVGTFFTSNSVLRNHLRVDHNIQQNINVGVVSNKIKPLIFRRSREKPGNWTATAKASPVKKGLSVSPSPSKKTTHSPKSKVDAEKVWKPYQCRKCSKTFASSSGIRYHLNAEHPKINNRDGYIFLKKEEPHSRENAKLTLEQKLALIRHCEIRLDRCDATDTADDDDESSSVPPNDPDELKDNDLLDIY